MDHGSNVLAQCLSRKFKGQKTTVTFQELKESIWKNVKSQKDATEKLEEFCVLVGSTFDYDRESGNYVFTKREVNQKQLKLMLSSK
jgi:hypothetical protein